MFAQPTSPTDTSIVLFRTLSSLSEVQVDLLEAALPGLAGSWCLERHESYEGNLLLLIMPADGNDMTANLTIDQDAAGLNLGVLRGDELTSQGCYDSMETLIPALRRLVSLEIVPMRDSRTS